MCVAGCSPSYEYLAQANIKNGFSQHFQMRLREQVVGEQRLEFQQIHCKGIIWNGCFVCSPSGGAECCTEQHWVLATGEHPGVPPGPASDCSWFTGGATQ